MTRPAPVKAPAPGDPPPPRVGELVRRALRQSGRSAEDLAVAVEVSTEYVQDLISGRRRAPRPGRTDLYERMATFLRIGRHALETSARAEREAATVESTRGPAPEVAAQLLALCEPATARELERRRAKDGGAELSRLIQRLIDVAQGLARKTLDERIGLRVAAMGRGVPYIRLRVALLEFLDVAPETLTLADVKEQMVPRIGLWDVDSATDVVRVVLRAAEPPDSRRRHPASRRGFQPRD